MYVLLTTIVGLTTICLCHDVYNNLQRSSTKTVFHETVLESLYPNRELDDDEKEAPSAPLTNADDDEKKNDCMEDVD